MCLARPASSCACRGPCRPAQRRYPSPRTLAWRCGSRIRGLRPAGTGSDAVRTGAHGRIRTCGLLLRRQSLYPLSYVGGILMSWGAGRMVPSRSVWPRSGEIPAQAACVMLREPVPSERLSSVCFMTNARILVVDDDRVIQQLLKVNLELEGYAVE